MKKLVAMLLVLTMVLGLSMTAMAEDTTYVNKDDQDLSGSIDNFEGFTKKFTATNGGTTPAATFSFNVTDPTTYTDNEGNEKSASTIPSVSVTATAFAEGATSETVPVSINVNNAPLGVYTYTITETDPGMAGVTIADPFYLVVTILRDENNGKHYVAAMHLESADGVKKEEIENTYKNGSLQVTKQVSGNMADQAKYFPFTVTFTSEAAISSPISVSFNGAAASSPVGTLPTNPAGETYAVSNNTYTFYLKHGESIKFDNVPEGVSYAVTEEAGEYTPAKTGDKGTIEGDKTAEFTNTLTATIDTGISMDSLPYIVIIALVAVAAAAFFMRRRRSGDE